MIYFIRHGETDWNIEKKTQGHTDIPLNDNGKKQALVLANKIKKIKINKIISSDLKRAMETAEIIGKFLKCNSFETDKKIREFNYGTLEGICRDELTSETWEIFNNHPEKLNAESVYDVFLRIKSFFENLQNDYNDNLLIVAHGGSLRVIKYYLENKIFDKDKYLKFYKDLKIKNADIFEWKNGVDNTVNLITFDDNDS